MDRSRTSLQSRIALRTRKGLACLLGESRRLGRASSRDMGFARRHQGWCHRMACAAASGNAHDRGLRLRGRGHISRSNARGRDPLIARPGSDRCERQDSRLPRNVHSRQSASFAYPAASAQSTQFFTEARKAWPRPVPASWKFVIAQTSDSFVLTANLGHKITDVTFFPLAESQVSNAAPQTLVPTATGFTLTLRKSDQLLKPIARLKGILVFSGEQPYSIDVPMAKSTNASAKGPG
jgi:hypothetical protein